MGKLEQARKHHVALVLRPERLKIGQVREPIGQKLGRDGERHDRAPKRGERLQFAELGRVEPGRPQAGHQRGDARALSHAEAGGVEGLERLERLPHRPETRETRRDRAELSDDRHDEEHGLIKAEIDLLVQPDKRGARIEREGEVGHHRPAAGAHLRCTGASTGARCGLPRCTPRGAGLVPEVDVAVAQVPAHRLGTTERPFTPGAPRARPRGGHPPDRTPPARCRKSRAENR